MGRGGLYYRATLPSRKSCSKGGGNQWQDPNSNQSILPPPANYSNDIVMEEIDSGDTGNIVDSSSLDLINEINEKTKKTKLTPIFIGIGLIIAIFSPLPENVRGIIFLATLLLAIPLYIYDRNRKTTVVFYDIEKDAEDLFRGIYDAFDNLKKSQKIWHISAKGDIKDTKYHAGANQAVKRKEINIGFENPKFIKTNIPTPSIPVGSQTIYFFPDKILFFEKNKVGGLSYKSANFSIGKTNFVEDERVPNDAKVVGQTWRYVNAVGSRLNF